MGHLAEIKEAERLDTGAKISFEGIGDFTQTNRYVFGMKSLKNSEDDWRMFIQSL